MLPGFLAVDEPTATAFATRVQELIRAVDQPPAWGWIVDLRQNGGGLMWPMLARIGPLLGERGWCDRFIEPARSVVLPGRGGVCRRRVGHARRQALSSRDTTAG